MSQIIISGQDSYKEIESVLKEIGSQKYLLVCDSSFDFLNIKSCFDDISIAHVKFDGFTPNPLYEDVCKGVDLFNSEKCDAIVAVGGGSAVDVAKCIKLYCKMNPNQNYLEQDYFNTKVPLIAIPTTAGTGSESTRYAVIYYEGKKQSVTHESIIPDYAVLEHSVLKTLPVYQKKCTLLDALCQGIESWWSVNSNCESKKYSKIAIETIMKYKDAYLNDNSADVYERIMLAANYAGRAINITQTTAAHAMSYKLTSMYGIPHGHAVAVCLPTLWDYMTNHIDKCIDDRGSTYLENVFFEISHALGCSDSKAAIAKITEMLNELSIFAPDIKDDDLSVLASSVNVTRLGNNPVVLGFDSLYGLYERIRIK